MPPAVVLGAEGRGARAAAEGCSGPALPPLDSLSPGHLPEGPAQAGAWWPSPAFGAAAPAAPPRHPGAPVSGMHHTPEVSTAWARLAQGDAEPFTRPGLTDAAGGKGRGRAAPLWAAWLPASVATRLASGVLARRLSPGAEPATRGDRDACLVRAGPVTSISKHHGKFSHGGAGVSLHLAGQVGGCCGRACSQLLPVS